jgi:hypothetical protein
MGHHHKNYPKPKQIKFLGSILIYQPCWKSQQGWVGKLVDPLEEVNCSTQYFVFVRWEPHAHSWCSKSLSWWSCLYESLSCQWWCICHIWFTIHTQCLAFWVIVCVWLKLERTNGLIMSKPRVLEMVLGMDFITRNDLLIVENECFVFFD